METYLEYPTNMWKLSTFQLPISQRRNRKENQKNSLEGLNNRFEMAEERISEPKVRSTVHLDVFVIGWSEWCSHTAISQMMEPTLKDDRAQNRRSPSP